MRRLNLLFVLIALALLGPGTVLTAQQRNEPGMPTIAQVQVLNRTRADAIAVTLQGTAEVVPVSVVGSTEVTLAPNSVVGHRVARQAWEYRQIVVPSGQDAAALLNAAGSDGWEAVANTPGAAGAVTWMVKRPR